MCYSFIMRRFVYIGKNHRFTAFLDSNLHTRLAIVTANELGLAFPPRKLPKKIRPVLHCVKRKFRCLQNKSTSLWNSVPNSGLWKFCCGILIVETCYRLSSRKMDAQSVINWTVVGQLSWQYLRAPTLDHCSLSPRSSSSVYSTIQSRWSISDGW